MQKAKDCSGVMARLFGISPANLSAGRHCWCVVLMLGGVCTLPMQLHLQSAAASAGLDGASRGAVVPRGVARSSSPGTHVFDVFQAQVGCVWRSHEAQLGQHLAAAAAAHCSAGPGLQCALTEDTRKSGKPNAVGLQQQPVSPWSTV
jgi:hypothetical protein